MSVLTIQNLVKVYPGSVAALQGVSLEIPSGMYGLLGPNGAGKSTLMRIVAGLLEPTSGSVVFEGADIVKRPDLMWAQLGFLPQDFGFYPNLTGAAMLDFLLQMKGVQSPKGRKALVYQLLERVNLTSAAHRKTREYSGGMRQRLGIAQAIAGNPKLLIVDEPTAGLDPEERQRFAQILGEMAEERTVILSTHIVEDVSVLCPRFAIIRQGRVVAQTTPFAARAAIMGMVYEGTAESAQMPDLRREYLVTQAAIIEGIYHVRLCLPDGDPPPNFQQTAPTLEDAYLAAVNGLDLSPPPEVISKLSAGDSV